MTLKDSAELLIGTGIDPVAWSLVGVAVAVAVLTMLIAWLKMLPLIAFVIASIVAALILGLPAAAIPGSIDKGIGDLLGSLTVIVCLGAVFGKLIAGSGAAQTIAVRLIRAFGPDRLPMALTITGLVVGIPLFYNVGFVVMVPLLFTVVAVSGKPPITLAIPLLAGLSVAHGFLPPHPAPTALVGQFHADLGLTLLYGLAVGIPTLIIAGPLFARTLRGIASTPTPLFQSPLLASGELPGALASFATALLPVVLLSLATVLLPLTIAVGSVNAPASPWRSVILLLGNPMVVMLIAVGNAYRTLGHHQAAAGGFVKISEEAIREVAPILLVIAGAGALKQVLEDAGIGMQLGAWLKSLPVSPLILGWTIAAIVRIAVGSATVAGVTAAGLLVPLVRDSAVNPNLMVLAIGAGSLMCSHLNDSGFWMFKEYFNLSLRDTFRSWTAMETLAGTCGLGFVLVLSKWV